jgi:predicted ATPase
VLKGLPEPVACWQVEADRSAITRFEARHAVRLAPMVGRDGELALLLGRWARARAGEGQAVLVLGEAGIGKSRLAVALAAALAGQDHLVLRYQCSPQHEDSPLWPVIEQLRWSAGLARECDEQARLAKLDCLLRRAVPDPGEALPLLAELLGVGSNGAPVMLSAQQKRSRMLAALVDQLLGLARQRPVLLLFEDVHWMDPTTLDLVEQVLGAIGSARVLALMTSRTEGQPVLAGHPHLTRITLSRLDREAARAIVSGLAADRPLDDGVCSAILARAEGIPLFLEEVTRAMLDGDATAETIPGSLHDWLMARLDRSPTAHRIAQVAACIGRAFGHDLLVAVADLPEPELTTALDELIRAELVFRRGVAPDAVYSFKHALLRDAAHGSLLKSRRRAVHARIAQVLAGQFPELAQAAPEVIARHWAEGGQMAEAAAWHQRAGEQALARSATREAMAQLHAGLEALDALPEGEERQRRELELQAALGAALFAARGQAAGETAIAYGRARELCRRLGESRRLVPVLFGLWASHNTRAELLPAEAIAGELLQLAQAQDDRLARLLGLRARGTTLLFLGRFGEARAQLETLLELAAESDGPFGASLYPTDPRVTGRGFLAWILLMLGHPGQAVPLVERALAEARALGHQPTLAVVLQCRCTVAQFLDDHPAVALHAEALLAACASQGFAFWSAMGEIFRGWALARGGDVAAGTRHIQAGIAAHQATEATLLSPHYLALLAEVQLAAGRADEASTTLASALSGSARTGECWFDAELLRRQGELLAGSDPIRAEDCLRRALLLAGSQRARLWELRAATSLARFLAGRDGRGAGRDLLAPIVASFGDGQDMPDLWRARALLDRLA